MSPLSSRTVRPSTRYTNGIVSIIESTTTRMNCIPHLRMVTMVTCQFIRSRDHLNPKSLRSMWSFYNYSVISFVLHDFTYKNMYVVTFMVSTTDRTMWSLSDRQLVWRIQWCQASLYHIVLYGRVLTCRLSKRQLQHSPSNWTNVLLWQCYSMSLGCQSQFCFIETPGLP